MPNFTETKSGFKKTIGLTILFCIVLFAIFITFYIKIQITPPENFNGSKVFEVSSGMSVRDIAQAAANQGVVRSEFFLYSILTYSYDPTDIFAGTYVFEKPTSVFGVAQKLADKDIENKLSTITLPEGIPAKTIAAIAEKKLGKFDAQTYIDITKNLEGYLFPETYFVPEEYTAKDLLQLQRNTYEENIAPLRKDIETSSFSEYEVLILASIIEREANDENSMKMVSGVLQNRMGIGMALQADASIEYVLEKPLSELTAADLKVDSPYNTYTNTGLPPTPIGNPGIMAIKAVLYPTTSDNFFYITAPDGTFYYAETFAGHNRNIAQYLR